MTSFQRDPNYMSDKPRRVRGGVRLSSKMFPLSLGWAGTRWLDAMARCASESDLRDGYEYARAGQARSMTVEPGRVAASVQGRAVRAYRLTLQVQTFSDEEWGRVVQALSEQAIYSARLLAGEMPSEIEGLFSSLGMALFPMGPQDIACACAAPNEKSWCKHACCAGLLMAEALDRDPGLILTMRGLPAADLLERLRDHRTGVQDGGTASSLGVTDRAFGGELDSPPLESQVEDFWEAGAGLAEIETPIGAPEVSHPLLRRLGPSPFPDGKFPLVGLLATCYDVLSKEAIDGAGAGPVIGPVLEPEEAESAGDSGDEFDMS